MSSHFTVNYHDALRPEEIIAVDPATLRFHDGQWVIRIGDLSIFLKPERALVLRDAIEATRISEQAALEADHESELAASNIDDGGVEEIERQQDIERAGEALDIAYPEPL